MVAARTATRKKTRRTLTCFFFVKSIVLGTESLARLDWLIPDGERRGAPPPYRGLDPFHATRVPALTTGQIVRSEKKKRLPPIMQPVLYRPWDDSHWALFFQASQTFPTRARILYCRAYICRYDSLFLASRTYSPSRAYRLA